MNFNSVPEIEMSDFFCHGRFGHVTLGMTTREVMSYLPTPDTYFDEEMLQTGFDVWTYGTIEFHFERDVLFLIHQESLNTFGTDTRVSAGNNISLKRWIFEKPEMLTFSYILSVANTFHLDFKKRSDDLGIGLRLSSGVEMTFENTDNHEGIDPNFFLITSFSLSKETPSRWN